MDKDKQIWRLNPTYPVNQLTANFIMNPKPPTIYAILNSIANYGKLEYTKIRDLSKVTHDKIFDFDYDLSDKVDKDQFEIDILNHYMEQRIGFDTVTSFQLHLENKLHEILPYYNIMFDSLSDYSLFNDGEKIVRDLVSDTESSITGNNTADLRYSKYPQNQLTDISNGSYVTDQNYNKTNSSSNSDMNNTLNEVITRSPTDKMKLYESYIKTKNSIMSKIYKDLDSLFYQVVE
ncbi:MAG: hypothetical protein J6W64_02705 [Bacilli bacterium]|nr:hypothetical protein [Bacilli bacterium]